MLFPSAYRMRRPTASTYYKMTAIFLRLLAKFADPLVGAGLNLRRSVVSYAKRVFGLSVFGVQFFV
jgi:hypothetical protein